jgi:hypothetical protein
MIDHVIYMHICWPWSIQYCHIYVANTYAYNEENPVIQDVIKVGGIVTAVSHVQLHVLEGIIIPVVVHVCGDVIQTTV